MSDECNLHLGCGRRYLPGYIHVDLEATHAHIDYNHRIDALPMFANASVDLIYVSHALSYFDTEEVMGVLKEWRRVLKSGGRLRLAVPDFEALVQRYQDEGDISKILGPLYGRWPINAGQMKLYHKATYDFAYLKQVLMKAGFAQIQRWDWRSVFVEDMAGYDDFSQAYYPHMDKEQGLLISLNVECVKPAS